MFDNIFENTFDIIIVHAFFFRYGVLNATRTKHKGGAGVNFINVLHTAFTLVDPKSIKHTVKSSVTFYTFGIYERKSCM